MAPGRVKIHLWCKTRARLCAPPNQIAAQHILPPPPPRQVAILKSGEKSAKHCNLPQTAPCFMELCRSLSTKTEKGKGPGAKNEFRQPGRGGERRGGGGVFSTASDVLHIFSTYGPKEQKWSFVLSCLLCVAKPIKRVNKRKTVSWIREILVGIRIRGSVRYHWLTDPEPVFSSVADKMQRKKIFYSFFAHYFLKVYLLQCS